jgi:hypothetical protein
MGHPVWWWASNPTHDDEAVMYGAPGFVVALCIRNSKLTHFDGEEVICGGGVGSLEWEMLLLRLDWSATGALVFD